MKSPGFTATALLTVAVCLGANLAIFAVINSVLLRPLPLPQADRLVTIYNSYPNAGIENDGSSITNYYERRGNIPALESLSIYMERAETVGDPGSMQQEAVVRITPEFFATLGVSPTLGRAFTEEEAAAQRNVIILTDAFWRERFASDPNVLGRQTRVNGIPRTIVGVLPADFHFLSSEARVFTLLKSDAEQRSPKARHSGGGGTHMIARLRPGATVAQAQAQIDAHNAAVERDNPEAQPMAQAGFRSPVVPLQAYHVRAIRATLWLLQAAVLFLLLIGVVNLTNLLLIRASNRAKEMAIRRSMGASRRHVIGQVVTETVVLTAAGGVLGVLVGAWGTQLLQVLGASRLPLGAQVAFDGRLAVIGLCGAILLGIVIAVPITWFNLSSPLANALQSESRTGTTSRTTQRLRHGFIVAQIALAFVLLAGAALLGLSLKKVMTVSPGFRADHVLSGECTISWQLWKQSVGIVDQLLESIGQQPGVIAAGTITNIPLSGNSGKTAVTPRSYTPAPGESLRGHYCYGVEGDYFAALGIPLRRGRLLTSADSQRGDRVCVVDEEFARRYWPQSNAVGQQVAMPGERDDAKLFSIVGIVGVVKQAELTEPDGQGAVYLPYAFDHDHSSIFVVARTTQRPEAFGETLRKLVRAADPELAFDNVRSMERRVADSVITRRSPTLLAGIFAGVALLLATIGTYGVLSYAVATRAREIGIRMALGAQKKQIGAQFLSLGLGLVAAGITIGTIGACLAGRAMQSVLFAVPTLPIAALSLTAVLLTVVAFFACLIPARRATHIDPAVALRAD